MGDFKESKDFKKLRRFRKAKKVVYNISTYFANVFQNRYFDVSIRGKENLPDRSALIALHHGINFNWLFIGANTPRKCHGWFDDCVFKQGGLVEEVSEMISIKTDVSEGDLISIRKYLRRTNEMSKYWLNNTDEFVVATNDGPSKDLKDDDGTLIPLDERPIFKGLANLAYSTGAPIVPYSFWIPKEHEDNLYSSKGILKDWKYLRENKKIPYKGMFGEPIIPQTVSKNRLRRLVREQQINIFDHLCED